MRTTIFLLLLATPAFAQPVTSPSTCEVTISRAPDEVREAIEAWVKAEPRCYTTLDVRVVATDGGYYLFARDGTGRVRERVVPDPQSAGVLVASWAADDGIAPPSTTPPHVDATMAPPGPTNRGPNGEPTNGGSGKNGGAMNGGPSRGMNGGPMNGASGGMNGGPMGVGPSGGPMYGGPSGSGLSGMGPGAMPADGARVDDGVRTTERQRGRWLTLGAMAKIGDNGGGGLRAELDIKRRGKWTLGAVLAGSSTMLDIDDGISSGYLETVDVRLLATIARTTSFGKWDMRLAFGAGAMSTYAKGELGTETIEGRGIFPTAEASVLFSRELRSGWALAAGPVVTWYLQEYKFEYDDGGMATLERRDLDVMLFGGVRHRL